MIAKRSLSRVSRHAKVYKLKEIMRNFILAILCVFVLHCAEGPSSPPARDDCKGANGPRG